MTRTAQRDDAVDRYLCGEVVDQLDDGRFEGGARRDGTLGDVGDALCALRPHVAYQLVLAET